jgi:hypothetical protein
VLIAVTLRGMWSDSLLLAERAHLVRLIAWGAGSVIAGTALFLLVTMRRGTPDGSPLLTQFAVQCAAWGAIDLVLAALAWRGLAERDVVGATKLDRLLWLNTGLNVGYIAVGVTLAVVGWQLGRRLGLVGAGLGVTVQGLALLVLDGHFLNVINRLAVR